MKILQILVVILLAGGVTAWQWRAAEKYRAENDTLRFEKQSLEDQLKALKGAREKQRDAEMERLKAEAGEAGKIQNELNQLQLRMAETDKLGMDNIRLRSEVQQLRNAAQAAANTAAQASDKPADKPVNKFAKEAWTFAGYATPESTLISSLWAMREGKPQAYLDSLSPEEQARMAQRWANQSEADIAAKHQSDISTITGMQVLNTQDVSPTEKQMTVFIEGPNRTENVSMKLVGDAWKFGGFIRQGK